MGLEEDADAGLDIDDIVNICKGHVKDRYQVSQISTSPPSICLHLPHWVINDNVLFVFQFSPSAPLQETSPGYNKDVTLNDKINCVVYVVDTCKVSLLTPKMLDKFAAIRKKTNLLG